MKILNRVDPKDWVLRTKCEECTSELEVETTDLLMRAAEDNSTYFTFQCPVCQRQNGLSSNDVPRKYHFAIERESHPSNH